VGSRLKTVPFSRHAELTPLARVGWYHDDDGPRFLGVVISDACWAVIVGRVTGAQSESGRGADDLAVAVGSRAAASEVCSILVVGSARWLWLDLVWLVLDGGLGDFLRVRR
jgi:hypothetical protein